MLSKISYCPIYFPKIYYGTRFKVNLIFYKQYYTIIYITYITVYNTEYFLCTSAIVL